MGPWSYKSHGDGTDGTNETKLHLCALPRNATGQDLAILAGGSDQTTSSADGRKYSEISYLTGVVQVGQGAQQDGAGQQTVTGTCVQTHRGTQRVTVYGTHFSMHRGI